MAIMSAALGVKSAVISIRFPRGRTPMPVERRLVASSITGTGRMYESRLASFSTVRRRPRCSGGTSQEML